MNKKYVCADFSVLLEDSVVSLFSNYQKSYDFKLESGGIIVGIWQPLSKEYIVTDVTEPFPKDKCAKNRFKRAEEGHQDRMDYLWKTSGLKKMYIGEWHTHCENLPNPSLIDIRDWKRISKIDQNCQNNIFIIVGKTEYRIWSIIDDIIVSLIEIH